MPKGETVYRPGVDDVQPPSVIKQGNSLDFTGSSHFQVLLNSEGTICSVRVVYTTDRLSSLKLAKDIQENWKFSPAIKDGKPVAASIPLNLDRPPH